MFSENSPPRILLVDDEPRNRRLLAAILAPEGYAILEAGSGEEALEALANGAVDLVLLDVMMPGIGGVETCRRIREGGDMDLPVVFVTALGDRDSRIRGKAVGADDFLTKPVDETELLVRVETLLKLKAYHDLRHRHEEELEEKVAEKTVALRREMKARQALQGAKEEFVKVLSHELRTPLGIVKEGIGQVLEGLHGRVPDEQAEMLLHAANGAERLSGLVENLIGIASLGGERASLQVQGVDLSALADRAVRARTSEAEAKGLSLTMARSDPVPALADPEAADRVLDELLANAIRFTPNGNIRVAASVDGSRALIAVADDGCGIPARDLDRIFEPFSQVDRQEGSGARGVGLGLAVAKRLMELQGASISVASEVGRGTTMVASWPVGPSPK